MPTAAEWQSAVTAAFANLAVTTTPYSEQAIVDRVRQYFNTNVIAYTTFTRADVATYLPTLPEHTSVTVRKRLELANRRREIVCAVGDSITEGVDYDDVILGRYPRTIPSADMGIGGNTTLNVIDRLSTILATNARVYLLAIGVNDVRYNDTRGATTQSAYLANMTIILDALRGSGADVFVVGIWPSFTGDAFASLGQTATNNLIDQYNSALATLCQQKGATLVNATTKIRTLVGANIATHVPDGIHPSTTGRVIYADAVMYGDLV